MYLAHVSFLPDLVDFTDEEEVPAMDLHEVYDYYSTYLDLKQIEVLVQL